MRLDELVVGDKLRVRFDEESSGFLHWHDSKVMGIFSDGVEVRTRQNAFFLFLYVEESNSTPWRFRRMSGQTSEFVTLEWREGPGMAGVLAEHPNEPEWVRRLFS